MDKRKIKKFVLLNLRIVNGTIEFDWNKPFDLMVNRSISQKWGGFVDEFRTFLFLAG